YSRMEAAGTSDRGAGRWLDPAADTIELRNLEQARVRITATAPRSADAGGHYAAVVVRSVEDTAERASPVTVRTQIAAHFLLLVPGAVRYEADIEEIDTGGSFAWRHVPLEAVVRNSGNI